MTVKVFQTYREAMVTLGDYIKYLLQLKPQMNASRLSLYQYLMHQRDLDERLSPMVFADFYDHALHFEFWRNNAKELGQITEQDLQQIYRPLDFDPAEILHCHQFQVIRLERMSDLHQMIEREWSEERPEKSQLRLLKEGTSYLISLQLSAEQRLIVRRHSPVAKVLNGRLQSLKTSTELTYDAGMELVENHPQRLDLSDITCATFSIDQGEVVGNITQDYSFQKIQSLQGSVSGNESLFYGLKRIERHYIDTRSDPTYQSLVEKLDQANERLHQGGSVHQAESVLIQGRQAFKQIFPNDKLLHLLLCNLEYSINSQKVACPNSKSGSINTSPSAGSPAAARRMN